MRVLITGVAGFTGRYVAAELIEAGHTVTGLVHPHASDSVSTIDMPDVAVQVADLLDRNRLAEVVNGLEVDAVVHLAAISYVAHGDADELYRSNVVGTRNLLEVLDAGSARPHIVVLASSANIYGNA